MNTGRFNVFDPEMNLRRNYFIEASAGTGKTYTIENLVVRLMQEGVPLDQILVVTFTRAATVELKLRIRRTMEEKKLKKQLAGFDDAKIFTIHGFCFHTLKEHAIETGFALNQNEESASQEALKNIYKDFLRTELSLESIHPQQLERLLKAHGNDPAKLFKEIIKPQAGAGTSFFCLQQQIIQEVHALSLQSTALLDELLVHAPKFGKICDTKKQIKAENREGLQRFCALFDGHFDNLFNFPVVKLVPENLLKNKGTYPELLHTLNRKLIPLLAELDSKENTLKYLRAHFKNFTDHVCQGKDLFFYEDLLKKMHASVQEDAFCKNVREHYQVVLIDEFQDTDQIQWEIFSRLFLGHLPLYLVGDPKQSIYRFRGADLYTYLEAKEKMGEESWTTLTRNYRSDPALISALNCLFSRAPDLIQLPKNKYTLAIPHIEAGLLPGKNGQIIFCQAADEKALFSFIIEEIEQLRQREGMAYRECAILVKDHFQAKRFCSHCPLPFVTKKSSTLLESEALCVLEDLLMAAMHPRERQGVLKVMGGPLFTIPLEELGDKLEEHVRLFYGYHRLLQQEGVIAFFKSVAAHAVFPSDALYLDMLQLTELLAEQCSHVEDYLPYLHSLQYEDPESEKLKARSKCGADALQVMTLHVSKGLEFSAVFPIGLISAYKDDDEEEACEKMRQLYVALTRAKQKLYLPLIDKENTYMSKLLEKVLQGESLEAFVQNTPHFSLVQCAHIKSTPPILKTETKQPVQKKRR